MIKALIIVALTPVALVAGILTVCIAIGTVKAIKDTIKKNKTM